MNSGNLKVKNEDSGRSLRSLIRFTVFFFSLFTLLLTTASAQDGSPDLAPPPLKIISQDERGRLDGQTDLKKRTQLVLELMTGRLTMAEKLGLSNDFDGVFRELGGFHGLMDNGLDYLQKRDTGRGKVLDNFKRIEIALRAFRPRIESIRRELPSRYEDYMITLLKYVRDARTKATEPLFADTVVPQRKTDQ